VRSISRKVWLGIGIATLVGGSATPGLAQHSGHGTKAKAPPSADGATMAAPQSGETYLTDGGPKDTRIRIYRDIALMRGHLLVGAELVALGRWDEALPHFLHPTEELYGLMERHIKLHKVTPFDRQLKQLAQAVKAQNLAAYRQAARVVDERLTNALTSFRRFMQGAPFTSFTMQTVVEVMKVVAHEYEAAIEDGRFAKPVEYQDSRGFLLYAERLVETHRSDLEKIDKPALEALVAIIAGIKPSLPTALPPERPLMSVKELSEKIEAFEKRAGRFF
jgi:hypothetical protein